MPLRRQPDKSLVVTERSLSLGREPFVRTDNGTELMNVDGRAGGSPVVLWNGTGAGDTGADWTPSGQGSETSGSMHAGTNGWDTGVVAIDTNTVFDSGSMQDIAGSYGQLQFWMQPKAYPGGSRLRVAFLNGANTRIGDSLNVADYASNMDLDVWQQVSIPISDFALTGNVQKLRFAYRNKANQHYWFDDIELVASSGGGPYRFQIAAPDASTVYHLSMAVLMIAAPSSGWNLNAFANISGGIGQGLIFRQRRLSESEVLWKFVTRSNMELFGQFHPQEDITFADGNLLVGFMVKPGRGSVLITDDDVLEIVVRDNLTAISEMRAYCHYGIEAL